MTVARRSGALALALAVVAGPLPAAAQDAAAPAASGAPAEQTSAVGVTPLFVVREEGPAPFDTAELSPGEVLALRLDWEGERPEGGVSLVSPGVPGESLIPLRVVLEDPRAGGADVVEAVVLGLGETSLQPLSLRLPSGRIVQTEPLTLEVSAALSDEDTEPAGEKGQARIGLDRLGVALVASVLLLLAGAVAGLLFYDRRRRRDAPLLPARTAPEVPPHVWANAALDELLASNLLAEGRMKEFHVRLAEISKGYLSRRFGVALLEHTTAECADLLVQAGVERGLAGEVKTWLQPIDLVKFAGERPPSPQVVASVQALRNMVDRTTPRPSGQELARAADQAEAG